MWPLRVGDIHKIEAADHYCLHWILWQHFILKTAITLAAKFALSRNLCSQDDCFFFLFFFGHALCWQLDKLIHEVIALDSPPHGWQKQHGGQLKVCLKTVKEDIKSFLGLHMFGTYYWYHDSLVLTQLHLILVGFHLGGGRLVSLMLPAQPILGEWHNKNKKSGWDRRYGLLVCRDKW